MELTYLLCFYGQRVQQLRPDLTDDIDADLILRRKDDLTLGILSYGFALCYIPVPDLVNLDRLAYNCCPPLPFLVPYRFVSAAIMVCYLPMIPTILHTVWYIVSARSATRVKLYFLLEQLRKSNFPSFLTKTFLYKTVMQTFLSLT